MGFNSPYSFLPTCHLASFSAELPVRTDLLSLFTGSGHTAWRVKGWLVVRQADSEMWSLA